MDLMGGVGKSKQTTCFVVMAMLFSAMVVASYYFLRDGSPTPDAFKAAFGANSVAVEKGNEELARILKRAATPDKTVIVTNLNEAWAAPDSLFELMLESFRRGNGTEKLIKHLLMVCVDDKAYAHCLGMNLNCFHLEVQGFNFSGKEAFFKSANYLEIIWRKVDVLRTILSLGYNFLFTDTDIMWLRDPFIHLQEDEADFQVSCDKFNGHPTDIYHNFPNTGIMHVKSNRRTILFFKLWYYSRRFYEGKHEQEVFNYIKLSPVMRITGLKVKFLDPTLFGGFCSPSQDFNKVCTMHGNCCTGLNRKIHDLKLILGDWDKYSKSPEKPPYPFRWTAPMQCPRRYP
ncbi:hypothetical protein V2J09_005721 [Rumex salicifolius]